MKNGFGHHLNMVAVMLIHFMLIGMATFLCILIFLKYLLMNKFRFDLYLLFNLKSTGEPLLPRWFVPQ